MELKRANRTLKVVEVYEDEVKVEKGEDRLYRSPVTFEKDGDLIKITGLNRLNGGMWGYTSKSYWVTLEAGTLTLGKNASDAIKAGLEELLG